MKTFQKYWAIFQITLINSLAYPGELIGRSLMIIPFMWIFYQLWKVTYAASGSEVINGLTFSNVLWYLMLAETIELGRPPLARTISENVKDGSIAYLLNKPYDFLLYQFSTTMGETIFRAVMNAIFGGAVVLWLVGPPGAPGGVSYRAACVLGRLDPAFLRDGHDRSPGFSRGGCLCVHVDLPEAGVSVWRHVDPTGFLSRLAADNCQSTPLFQHDLWSGAVVRHADGGTVYQRDELQILWIVILVCCSPLPIAAAWRI